MTKIKLATGALLLVASSVASADFLGVYAGANRWNYDIEGDISSNGPTVDMNNDLGFSDDNANVYYVAFEHPVPFLPNVKVQRNNLDLQANGTASQSYTFDGVAVVAGNTTNTQLDLSNTDYTLYYEILDNWVNLDLGITGKDFNGEMIFVNSTTTGISSRDLSGLVPMAYGKAQFDLPFTGWSAGAIANIGQTDDDKINDMSAYISYEGDSGFGFEVGYRTLDIEFDDFDTLNSDMTFDGFYAGINFHF